MPRRWRAFFASANTGAAPATSKPLRRYERERKAALAPMGLAMDGLQQLFMRAESPVQSAAQLGHEGLGAQRPSRTGMARQAMGLA